MIVEAYMKRVDVNTPVYGPLSVDVEFMIGFQNNIEAKINQLLQIFNSSTYRKVLLDITFIQDGDTNPQKVIDAPAKRIG